jgi:hypothetical protein
MKGHGAKFSRKMEAAVAALGRLPNGKYHWEERPGPPPIDAESQNRLIVEFVRAEPDPEGVTGQE